MSASLYIKYKAKHDSIKPIRGKTVRPISNRRKLHEQIREVVVDGVKGIALRLYNTDCVTYLENGNILFSAGGYNTQTTQKFINAHSHLSCSRQYNYLWVYMMQPGYGMVAVPLPTDGKPLLLEPVEGSGFHRIVLPEPLLKKSVDKVKAKEARAPLMPFLNWVKTFLAMSDGFVAYPKPPFNTPEQLSRSAHYRHAELDRYNYLARQTEEQYLSSLYGFPTFLGAVVGHREGGMVLNYNMIKTYLYNLAVRATDAYKYQPVELHSRPIKDLHY